MNISTILSIVQLVLAALLVVAILLQQRGTGLGSSFGGEGNVFATRRGVERILLSATIVFAILSLAVALAQNLLA